MAERNHFDIIIIGGGHAGVEAAHIAAQFDNLSVAIVTMPNVSLASAPCNPSVGGVGKGQVVREIDALGGIMGRLADLAGIQFRTLNESKGFAVQSTRIQIDKEAYSLEAERIVSEITNVEVIREKVVSVNRDGENFQVKTDCSTYDAKKIIVTVGTFLNGKLHIGNEQSSGGRMGADVSSGLSDIFSEVLTNPLRFKTGTPPRLHKNSINYSVLEEQPSDSNVHTFHHAHGFNERFRKQVSCYLAHTNSKTIETILANKEKSPMFNGQIKGVGARYCPSIEDKAFRYPHKHNHHVFIEPEGLELDTVYPSGISSSLPRGTQLEMIRSLHGLENAEILQYGYAVEYDVVDTTHLNHGLEHKGISGLYFAGQVNGTSGYEEAAGQGLIAGINAALAIQGRDLFILDRDDSYIGVMIEDLISNTRDEPYRLFTARSENRLYIREDNAISRMFTYRDSLLLNNACDEYNKSYVEQVGILLKICDEVHMSPDNAFFEKFKYRLARRMSIAELLRQSDLNPIDVFECYLEFIGIRVPKAVVCCVAISKKYEGYIKKASDQYSKIKRLDRKKIDWEYLLKSENISFECKQRIGKIRPVTFGQLRQIEGLRQATLVAAAGSTL